jgi:hypothetical protein
MAKRIVSYDVILDNILDANLSADANLRDESQYGDAYCDVDGLPNSHSAAWI